MRTNRVLLSLVGLLVLMQGYSLYRQMGTGTGNRTGSRIRAASQQPILDAPVGATLSLEGLPSQGADSARVVMIEFSDYECPYCARHAAGAGHEIQKNYVLTGKMKHVFVNNPLAIHPAARLLAKAAMCAGQQNRYWDMHDSIFRDKLRDKDNLISAAKELGLNVEMLGECLDHGEDIEAQIDRDIASAAALQLSGTPAFAIGTIDSSGKVQLRKLVKGALTAATFDRVIREVFDEL
jgi:protein-disulfide isomerase